MAATQISSKAHIQDQLQLLDHALNSGALLPVARMLNSLAPQDVAHLLESSPPKMRHAIWQLVEVDGEGDVLQYLSEEVQSQFLEDMDANQVLAVTEGMEADDIADILQQLPNRVIQEVLQSMDLQDRHRIEKVIHFAEDSAGGLMSTDIITVREAITLDVVIRFLRRHDELPPATDNLFVVNRRDELIGILPLSTVLVNDPNTAVRDVMITDVKSITADTPERDVALLFERHDWISAPVTASNGELLGRITIDDVVDVIRDEAEHGLLGMAGLSEDEDTFASIGTTAPKRAVWLGINLLTAILASSVIKIFEGTIDQVVALAVLMPIVASMGGVAGSQTLTIVIRGIALGQIGRNNSRWLLNREVIVSLFNGIVWALVIAAATMLIYGDALLSLIIAIAMIINLVTAGLMGTLLPIMLKKLHIDPALAGSVILTTVTDVVGFAAFLGLATWFYL
ncbi:MAG: magnesium transporter [Pseudomonadales bacterium]|nr:magnesium transporter [Pseudomonadales bacterium]